MDESTSFDKTKRQTINPLMDEINRQTEPLLKSAITEYGLELPLTFRLYNQIRFYEEFGKLKAGFSVVSKETLAEQFGVTVQQIDRAYNNLTTKYKLGKWVNHDEPVFRNVKRSWVSKVRLQKGLSNYYSVVPKLLQRSSKTTTAEYLPPLKPPLSESKKKVSESNNGINIPLVQSTSWIEYEDCFGMYRYARKDSAGYVLLSKNNPPHQGKGDMIARHRWVYEKTQGEIPEGYDINHINRIKGDDRPENLEALTASQHQKKHRLEETRTDNRLKAKKDGIDIVKTKTYGSPELNIMFAYWQQATGLAITARLTQNRRAACNLLKRYGAAGLERLIDGVAAAQDDKYAPRIADFTQLQSKVDELILWGKKKSTNQKRTIKV